MFIKYGSVPCLLLATVSVAAAQTVVTHHNDLPPRFQWSANYGYCGETAFITAGLYYGQYLSQYDARSLANGTTVQNRESSQLLLGVNDTNAATRMHLDMTRWKGAGSTPFLSWVKRNVVAGKPVIIGVFTNSYLFDGDSSPSAGYSEYDHIVPVHTITSRHPLSDSTVYPDDTLTFSDNGLYGDDTPEGSPYDFSYSLGIFPRTRAQANATGGPVYSLPSNTPNYGVVITGVKDAFKETVPVGIKTRVNHEWPEMVDGSNARPAPGNVTLTVTISGLKPGIDYNLYRYNSMAAIPNGSFNSNAAKAAYVWPIKIFSGSTYTLTQTISSNQTVAYRAVPASAR